MKVRSVAVCAIAAAVLAAGACTSSREHTDADADRQTSTTTAGPVVAQPRPDELPEVPAEGACRELLESFRTLFAEFWSGSLLDETANQRLNDLLGTLNGSENPCPSATTEQFRDTELMPWLNFQVPEDKRPAPTP